MPDRNRPRLAICIPTYNRAGYIRETLASILEANEACVQICVSDNASSDDTVALARAALAGHPDARIAVAPENRGADANYLAAVALADADYCLLLGSDDTLAPGALSVLRERLERLRPELLLFDRQTCTLDMRPMQVEHMHAEPLERSFDFADPRQLDRYFGGAVSLCAAFSYISGIVFSRRAWDAADCYEAWVGSAYVHSYKLMRACLAGARLHYLPQALVNCRLGNDSFRQHGLCRRVLIDLDGFARLAELLEAHGHPVAGGHLRALLRHEYPFWRLVRYQSLLRGDPLWREILERLGRQFGAGRLKLGAARLLGDLPGVGRASFILRDHLQRRRT